MNRDRKLLALTILILATSPGAAGAAVAQRPGGGRDLPRQGLDAIGVEVPSVPDVVVQAGDGRIGDAIRCGTPTVGRDAQMDFDAAVASQELLVESLKKSGKIDVPVAFWVIENSAGKGALTAEQLEAQIREMNRAFKKARISFHIDQAWLVTKDKWHKKCGIFKKNGRVSGVYKKMTRALAADPATTLNIYTCAPKSQILGTAWHPIFNEILGLGEDHRYNGMIVHHDTFPGGSLYPYELGATAIHEAGHYFGLWHTFQNGCEWPGDEIADTPYEGTPAYEAVPETNCAAGRDTCPFEPGLDPTENFMDYSSDYCLERFSKKQRQRMRAVMEVYRSSMCGQ